MHFYRCHHHSLTLLQWQACQNIQNGGSNNARHIACNIIPLHTISPNCIPLIRLIFGWLLHPPIQQKPLKLKATVRSLFFISLLNLPPKTTSKHPPPCFVLAVSPLQQSPHRECHSLVGCCIN